MSISLTAGKRIYEIFNKAVIGAVLANPGWKAVKTTRRELGRGAALAEAEALARVLEEGIRTAVWKGALDSIQAGREAGKRSPEYARAAEAAAAAYLAGAAAELARLDGLGREAFGLA